MRKGSSLKDDGTFLAIAYPFPTVFFCTMHRGAFCQFPFRWIYYYHSSKSTGKETGKPHLSAVVDLSVRVLSRFFDQADQKNPY